MKSEHMTGDRLSFSKDESSQNIKESIVAEGVEHLSLPAKNGEH